MVGILLTSYCGASARPTNGVRNRPYMGLDLPFPADSWVHRFRKAPIIREFSRRPYTCTIFEGTAEIQQLIIARAISGKHIR